MQNPIEVAEDAGWTWFNDERAILLPNGNLLAGYVRRDGQIAVTNFDFSTRTARETVLSSSKTAQRDDHNNPSLTRLPDGRILAVYSMHSTNRRYYWRVSRTENPVTKADWGNEQTKQTSDTNTYANVYLLNDATLYNFHRCLNWNPSVSMSADPEQGWGDPAILVKTGNGRRRPYTRLGSNGSDRIELIYTEDHPRDFDTSLYHIYFKEEQFHTSDGKPLKTIDRLPIDHDIGERGSLVYRYREEEWSANEGPDDWMPGARAWCWDVASGQEGKPVSVFQVRRREVAGQGWKNDRIYYYYAWWNGDGWRKKFIAQGGRPLYEEERDYGGGIAIDPTQPGIVYLSSNAENPFSLHSIDNVPLADPPTYKVYRCVISEHGEVDWFCLTSDLQGDGIRPKVVGNSERKVLLWMQGKYTSYQDYQTRLLCLADGYAIPDRPTGPQTPMVTSKRRWAVAGAIAAALMLFWLLETVGLFS